jgi:hypothetical protein
MKRIEGLMGGMKRNEGLMGGMKRNEGMMGGMSSFEERGMKICSLEHLVEGNGKTEQP